MSHFMFVLRPNLDIEEPLALKIAPNFENQATSNSSGR